MFAPILVAALSFAPRHHAGRPPKWLDGKLAGREVGADAVLYDPASGFMLVSGGECDGAIRYAKLTADRYEVARNGYNVPNFNPAYGATNGQQNMIVKKVPLQTGKGIRIGDSPGKVVARLGRPTKIKTEGWRKQFRVYSYSYTSHDIHHYNGFTEDDGRSYCQSYTFKNGKLIEIDFGSDSNMT